MESFETTLNKSLKDNNIIYSLLGLFMISLVFPIFNNTYAQEGNEEELREQYPLSFNENGQVKEYIDCKPEDASFTDLYGNERYANTGTAEDRIEGLEDSISFMESMNADGQHDELIEETQRELDCLEEVRSVKVLSGNMFS